MHIKIFAVHLHLLIADKLSAFFKIQLNIFSHCLS